MNRDFQFSVGELYHIYNRGNDKRNIFLNEVNYSRFVKLLFLCNGTSSIVFKSIPPAKLFHFKRGSQLIDIGAYCLMPNHFHLLVKEKVENGISDFMKKLSTAYSMYFNLKYRRTGKLFEGAFKAKHISEDEYLKYLYAYIHLNPIKLIEPKWKETGIKDKKQAAAYLKKYRFSSYLDFMGQSREEKYILNRNEFPKYFTKPTNFSALINEWLIQGETLEI
ncbi:MAG: transposase [Patescibacteria group bacterium]